MKHKAACSIMSLALAASFLPVDAQAQLRITEVQSSESGGDAAGHDDWWELTNLGFSSVNITGYKFNDSTGGTTTGAFILPTLSIAPGESIIFVESTTGQPMTIQGFRDWWGPGLNPATQIIVYQVSGIGLSSGGDQVNFWDASDVPVDSVAFGTATAGVSFIFDPAGATGRSPTGLSQIGLGGVFAAAQNGDIGSPGAVPEPSSFALMGLGAAGLFVARRRK